MMKVLSRRRARKTEIIFVGWQPVPQEEIDELEEIALFSDWVARSLDEEEKTGLDRDLAFAVEVAR